MIRSSAIKKIHHLLFTLLLWTALPAQSTSELKINPLLFVENSSPTLVYERTFGKHMAWELGLMLNEQKAGFGDWEKYINMSSDSFFNYKTYTYARLGGYSALRWYFSVANRHRGFFAGLMGSYTEPIWISPALASKFSSIDEFDYRFPYIEKRLLLGPILGYKQILWEHLTIEGMAYFSPYLTRRAKVFRDNNFINSYRFYGGLLIGYRFN